MQSESEGSSSWIAPTAGVGLALVLLGFVSISVLSKVSSAEERLLKPEPADKPKVAVAAQAEVGYCTPQFKQVLERVLHACGLSEGDQRRGCKPADVRTFASISDDD